MALGLLAAAPLLGLLLLGGILDRNHSIATAEAAISEAAVAGSKEQSDITTATAGILHLIANFGSVRRLDPVPCDQIVGLSADLNPSIASIVVVRPDGAIACSSRAGGPRPSLGDRDYFREALAAPVTADPATEVVQSRISSKPALIVAVPIMSTAQNTIASGVITASMDLGSIAAINERLPKVWHASVLLVNTTTGAVIAQSGALAQRNPGDTTGQFPKAMLAPIIAARSGEVVRVADARGRAMLFGVAPVELGRTKLAIGVGVLRRGVLADANSRIGVGIGLALVAVTLATAAALTAAQIGLLKPIGILARAADKLGAGDLSVRAPAHARARELRKLGLAFNRMAQRLQTRDQELATVQAELKESEEHHRLLAQNATDMITRFNKDFIRVYVSDACFDLLGYQAEELVGRPPSNIVHPDDWLMLDQALNVPLKAGQEKARATYRGVRKDGRELWLESSGQRLPDGSGFVVVTRDVSERVAFELELETANRQLEELATHDALTGLANRRRFEALLEAEYRRAWRLKLPVSVGFIDADHFKAYNDKFGHPAGDVCLQAIAKAIDGSLRRPGDLAARVGGEEFMVLFPGTDRDGAEHMGQLIRGAVHAINLPHPATPTGIVTVSIGMASFLPDGSNTVAQLVDAADTALYEVKRGGRDAVFAITM